MKKTKGKNNVTLLMQAWEAFNKNDLETANKIVSEDIIYKVSGRGPVSGIYEGRLMFRKLIEKVKELSGGTVTIKPLVTLADDEYVFVLARVTGRRGEKVLDIEHCYLYRFSNGQLVEGRTMPVDLYEFDEFWK